MRENTNKPTPNVTVIDGKAIVTAPKGYSASFLGSDTPQVIDDALIIHTPLTDIEVTLSFICVDADGKETGSDVKVAVAGEYGALYGKKPNVLPEPAQWRKVGNGYVKLKDILRISYSDAALQGCAELLADDIRALFGVNKDAILEDVAKQGSIRFEINGKYSYLGEEGYAIKADGDGIFVEVSAEKGAIWASKTILQLLAQSGFPYGEMRDYPRYPVRGCMLDVGRRPMTIKMLDAIVKRMAWYKMNDLQLHLSDNYIFLEHYSENGDASTFDAYEAFRLESSVVNERGETPTAKDHSYGKEEFREFIRRSAERGVRIVPEVDVPAHDLSLTKVFPQYMVKGKTSPLMGKRPLSDHLDVSRHETVEFIKCIFDDYISGDSPVFDGVTVHIGADEFLTDFGAYRAFINEIVPYIKKTNTVRMWGGLTWIKDKPETAIIPEAIEGVQMNLWSNAWADGREMYDMGYELINTIDHYLYMVPNGSGRRGAYTDLLDKNKIFKYFKPNRVRLKNAGKYIDLPAGDKRVLGAAFAIWHDNIDKKASGLTEGDTFDRFLDCAPLIAEKTWGHCTEKRGYKDVDAAAIAIGPPESADIHTSGKMGYTELNRAKYDGSALVIGGDGSYASTDIDSLPINSEITFDIEFYDIEPNAIITECDGVFSAPYDVRITRNGKLGFTREGYEYEFDYIPPVGKRMKLTMSSRPLKTVLKVGLFTRKKAVGSYTHNGKVKRTGITNSTFLIPCKRVGSATRAVNAKIYDISYRKI